MEAENKKVLGKKPIIIGAVSALAVIIAVVVIILINLNSITAINIRLRRLVGTVNLFDGNGKEKTIVENMRLNSGHGLKTAEESLVMLSLDDTKLLTLEEASKAKIKAKGKKLEFALESGSLFFNVNQKLENDESFDIRTSTMVCGIRGTSAYVGKDASGHETLMVTDGTVHVVAENPKTHEITEVDVSAGEMITIYLDEEAEGDATISITKTRFREEDLPALAIDAIQKDIELTDRISKATGFSKDKILILHKATSEAGVSMYGEAANELIIAGIDDAIPFQGSKSRIMVSAANSAADVAGENLPLESSVVMGVKGTVEAGTKAGFKDAEIETLAKSATDNTVKVILEAKDAGLKDDDLVKIADSVGGTINETVSKMGSGNYNSEHVNSAVEAIGTVMTEAITEAASEGGTSGVLSAVQNEADRVNGTVEAEVNKKASGEETVASILNELENRAVVSNEPNGDKNDTPAPTDDKPSEDKKETDTSGTTSGNTTGRRTTTATAGNTAQTGNTGNDNQSGSSSSSQTVAVSGVSLNISSFNMDVSDTVTVTATISPSNATNTGITWSSSDDTVASVSGSGLSAIVTGVSDGTATITATTADGGKTATFTATVQAGLVKYQINVSAVTNGTVSSSVTECAAGNPVTLTVSANEHYHLDTVYANGVNSSLSLTQNGNKYSFTMPAENVTAGATFTGDTYTLTLNLEGGNFAGSTIPTGYVYGTGTTLPANGTKADTDQISYTFDGWYTTRTGGTKVTSISTTDSGNKVLYARFTESPRQYGVTVSTGNVVNGNVTVTNSEGTSLTIAGSTAGYGTTVTVTATPEANCSLDALSVNAMASSNGASVPVSISGGTATITMPAYDVNISVDAQFIKNVTGVTLDNTTKSVGVGQTATLTATVAPADAADKSVSWSVSPAGIVTVTPGTGASANTATITGVSIGSATVTVTTTDGSKTATCTVTVGDAWVSVGDFLVRGGELDTDFSFDTSTNLLSILTDTAITVKNAPSAATTTHRIKVETGSFNADVTLAGVNINAASGAAFEVANSRAGNVTITLSGSNTLVSGANSAGLQKCSSDYLMGKALVYNSTYGTIDRTIQDSFGTAFMQDSFSVESMHDGYQLGLLIIQAEAGGSLTAQGGAGGAGIGGCTTQSQGQTYANTIGIVIKSGTVTATGGAQAAGIGGGMGGNGVCIEISGGNVTATGNGGGAGIGGGGGSAYSSGSSNYAGTGQCIRVSGGTVNATGGAYDVSTASSPSNIFVGGAGIGGGAHYMATGRSFYGGDASYLLFTGGTVVATGGCNDMNTSSEVYGGAGIGGGAGYRTYSNGGKGDQIRISGSTTSVTAIGGGTNNGSGDCVGGAGIGSGAKGGNTEGNGLNITITGGTVLAKGGGTSGSSCGLTAGAAGIGGGGFGGQGQNITISGGTVDAYGGGATSNPSAYAGGGAGIGGGFYYSYYSYNPKGIGSGIAISGGTVNAYGGGINTSDATRSGSPTGIAIGGSGIGGGGGSNGSNITISGGEVTSYGGGIGNAGTSKGGAGIGGGGKHSSYVGTGTNITIFGSTSGFSYDADGKITSGDNWTKPVGGANAVSVGNGES